MYPFGRHHGDNVTDEENTRINLNGNWMLFSRPFSEVWVSIDKNFLNYHYLVKTIFSLQIGILNTTFSNI